LIGGEIATYYEWKNKLHYKAMIHLAHPSEVWNTSSSKTTCIFMIVFFILFLIFYLFTKKYFIVTQEIKTYKTKEIIFYIILLPCTLLAARGGIQPIPIQLSDAYWSSYPLLNDISINTPWAFAQSIFENKKSLSKNPYTKVTPTEASVCYHSLLNKTQSIDTFSILKIARPNIMIFILESWSADLNSSFGGMHNVAPFMDSIAMQGLRFSNTYATGWTSDQGIASILSSQPAFEYSSIITQPYKMRTLSRLGEKLEGIYHTAFYYGGQLSYANIKAYLYDQKFKTIRDIKDYKSKFPSGKLGIHDGYLLPYIPEELQLLSQPFFACFFSQSTHAPYDFPVTTSLNYSGNEKEYVQGAFHTDSALRVFMHKASTMSWYDSTLFVFVSDHSHVSPLGYHYGKPDLHRIVFFLFGPALKNEVKGKNIDAIVSQNDVLPTLQRQLNIPLLDHATTWGNDALRSDTLYRYAPVTYHGAHGWISTYCWWFYNSRLQYLASTSNDASCAEQAESYFTHAYEDYLRR